MRALIVWMLMALPAFSDGGKPGEFDYYVLSLSWSPNWCAREGDARQSPQCEDGRGHGWILHGLWPQYHRGYPAFCPTSSPMPSRRTTDDMADIMGTSGLAWHQWRKHGVCTGLSASQYYALSREAYGRITRPPVFRKLTRAIKLPAKVVEQAFLEVNPTFEPDGVTVTCKSGDIQEVRICLSRDLDPVPCGADVVRDCTLRDAGFDPIR